MSAAGNLTSFIRALRLGGVETSPAEAIDAARAAALIGYDKRSALKSALRPTLAKSELEAGTYDRLFDLYFTAPASAGTSPQTTDETEPLGQHDTPDLLDLIQSGDTAALDAAMASAARDVDAEQIRFSTQIGVIAQKIIRAMGGDDLDAALLKELRANPGSTSQRAEDIIEARRALMGRARAEAQKAFDVFGAGETAQFREDILASKPLSALERHDIERMKPLIAKIARRLAKAHSRRRRRNTGVLDVPATLRANAGHGGVPFEVHWKNAKRDRPKIVAICDVSSSVARHVRFLLMLLTGLSDVVPDFRAFAFSGRLGEITDDMTSPDFAKSMDKVLRAHGMGSTDYGRAFEDFETGAPNAIDRKTSLIVLGDGRSNQGDPGLEIYRNLVSRARTSVWLCPEPETLWGNGDSEMDRFAPLTAHVAHVTNLKDLEKAVDRILAQYG
ncbi:MAG: VWA domain-containing protein [Pseudomonadota bacterium]